MSVAYVVVASMLVLISPGWAGSAASSADTRKSIEEAIVLQQQTQKQIDDWVSEKEGLLSRIRNLKNELRYVERQQEEYASYSRKQEQNIRRIEEKQEDLKRMHREFEPYLEEMVERLQDFVQSDLPFLTEEREKRLAFISESMGDYHLAVSEKFRRILEALQVEAEYGRYPEVDETFLDIDGKPTKVQMLRIGRLALYYLTLDGKKAGRYDPKSGRWKELPRDSAGEIKSAIQMIGKNRTMALVNLPVAP